MLLRLFKSVHNFHVSHVDKTTVIFFLKKKNHSFQTFRDPAPLDS